MIRLLLVLPLLWLLSGCATVFSNSAYPVYVDSFPQGARFVIRNHNGVEVSRGLTPATVILESGAGYFKPADYALSFAKPGYFEGNAGLYSNLNLWYLTNVVNVLGFAVDPASGAMWRLPQTITVYLPKHPR